MYSNCICRFSRAVKLASSKYGPWSIETPVSETGKHEALRKPVSDAGNPHKNLREVYG